VAVAENKNGPAARRRLALALPAVHVPILHERDASSRGAAFSWKGPTPLWGDDPVAPGHRRYNLWLGIFVSIALHC